MRADCPWRLSAYSPRHWRAGFAEVRDHLTRTATDTATARSDARRAMEPLEGLMGGGGRPMLPVHRTPPSAYHGGLHGEGTHRQPDGGHSRGRRAGRQAYI